MKTGETRPFKKISLDIGFDDIIELDREVIRYGTEVDGEFRGIWYNRCEFNTPAPTAFLFILVTIFVLNLAFLRHRPCQIMTIIFLALQVALFFAALFGLLPPTFNHPLRRIQTKIPKKYWDKFQPLYMHVNCDILPHVDSGHRTVINIYIKAGGYQTDFHTPKVDAVSFKLPNHQFGYRFEDVNTLCSFVAQDGDAFILDVSRLHSVHSGKERDRIALALSTNLSFKEVCAFFE